MHPAALPEGSVPLLHDGRRRRRLLWARRRWADRHERWVWIYLTLVGMLGSTLLLKVAQIQYLELINLLQMLLLSIRLVRRQRRIVLYRPLVWLGAAYAIFAAVAIVLALASLRFTFYFPEDFSWLRMPVYITLSRVVELGANVFSMLYLANLFRVDRAKLRYTIRVFFWTGVASAVYSVLSVPFALAHLYQFGCYTDDLRLRGFYNEGGPYGLYLLGLLLVGFVLYRTGWEVRRRLLFVLPLLLGVFVQSKSKAAFSGLFFLMLSISLLASSLRRRLLVLGVCLAGLTVVAARTDVVRQIVNYEQASLTYEAASHYHLGDPSYVYGRVAGLFIVPRMIAAEPYLGIGWGNYGGLRNRPEFRGASTWAEVADDPGLGLLGLTADLGIPLTLFLLVCLLTPVTLLRRLRVPAFVANLALVQPVAHLFGAQLNLTYPWIVTAFALGLGYCSYTERALPRAGGATVPEGLVTA